MTPSVYITVEESSRELESKLLVATCLAERGMNVVIGQQWLLTQNLRYLPPGLVFFKGNNGIQAINMRLAKRYGHLVASIEEENFGSTDAKEVLRNYDGESLKICDLLLVSSSYQQEILADHCPAVASKTRLTGNPRVDLFRPAFLSDVKKEGEQLRQIHGRFVLCNLNYCGVNSVGGDTLWFYDTCVRAGLYRRNNPADDRAFRDMLQWEHDNLFAMIEAIRGLRRHVPDIPIMVRPHPAERWETWRDVFAEQKGITLVTGGAHLPWTLASEVMIHTTCTTGTEAALAGHRAISICASKVPISDSYLSNQLNWRFDSPEQACLFVKGVVADDTQSSLDNDLRDELLDRHFAARTGRLSAERVADAFMAVLPPPSDAALRDWSEMPGFARDSHRDAWARQKMSAGRDEVVKVLQKLQRALSQFKSIEVIEIGSSVFRLCA